MVDVFARDSLRSQVEIASGGRNTVLYDSYGNPHVMVIIPRFRYEDLGVATELGTGWCTAFMANGEAVPEIFIGQYLTAGGATSDPQTLVTLPGLAPARATIASIRARAAAMGTGWHLMSAHEWAALMLWCAANETVPRGPTNVDTLGHSATAPHEWGRRTTGMPVRTGSGPDGWRHNHAPHGIADLVSGGGQWLDGVELVEGRFHVVPDNASWLGTAAVAQDAYIDITGGLPVLSDAITGTGYDSLVDWQAGTKSAGYVDNELLARLCIEPAGVGGAGSAAYNNVGTRYLHRGADQMGDLYLYEDAGVELWFRLAFCG